MHTPQTSLIGSPESYGIRLTTPAEVTEWIATTPMGVDPREHMSEDERNLFDTAVTPIGSFPIDEQQLYFDLIRKGNSVQTVREIACYDTL